MNFDEYTGKLFKVKWSNNEQRYVGVIEKNPPTDTSKLTVIGTCGKLFDKDHPCDNFERMHGYCNLHQEHHTPDWGCIDWRKKK